jgi:uncharacterized membrane protein
MAKTRTSPPHKRMDAAAPAPRVREPAPPAAEPRVPIAVPILFIVTGALGWWASFSLTLDKLAVLQATIDGVVADLDCNFSLLVQCGKNLESWQGSVFGFPNPLIGLGGFVAPIAVGVAILAGASFARWFWITFAVGVAGALAFCVWLMGQSFFSLGTLCPWCMLVWSVTIPLFWTVWLHVLSTGIIRVPPGAKRFFAKAFGFVPFITVVSYVIVALVAQFALGWITILLETGSL